MITACDIRYCTEDARFCVKVSLVFGGAHCLLASWIGQYHTRGDAAEQHQDASAMLACVHQLEQIY